MRLLIMSQPTEMTSVTQRIADACEGCTNNVSAEDLVSFKIAKGVNLYVPPFIIVLGSVVNVLAVMVMRTRNFRTLSTSIYMIAGSTNDVASLLISLLSHWIYVNFPDSIVRTSASHLMCKFLNFYGWGNCDYTIILTAAMTADRAFAVTYPLQTSATDMLRRARIVVVLLALLVVAKEFHLLIVSDIVAEGRRDRLCDAVAPSESYQVFYTQVWPWLHLVFLLLCFLVIVASNVVIVCNVWRSAKLRDFRTSWRNDDARKKDSEVLTEAEMDNGGATCCCFRFRREDEARGDGSGDNSSLDERQCSDQERDGSDQERQSSSPAASLTSSSKGSVELPLPNGRHRKYLPRNGAPRSRMESAAVTSAEGSRPSWRSAMASARLPRGKSMSSGSVAPAAARAWGLCPCWPRERRRLLTCNVRGGNSNLGTSTTRWQLRRKSSASSTAHWRWRNSARKQSSASQGARRASAVSMATTSLAQSRWRQMTTMLVAESLALLLLTFPFSLYLCLSMGINDMYSDPSKKARDALIFNVVLYLLYSNKVVNFCLYCASGSRFRQALQEILCCHKADKHPTLASLAALDRSERLPTVASFPLIGRAQQGGVTSNTSVKSSSSQRDAAPRQQLQPCLELSVISSSRSGRTSCSRDDAASSRSKELPESLMDYHDASLSHNVTGVSPPRSILLQTFWRSEGLEGNTGAEVPAEVLEEVLCHRQMMMMEKWGSSDSRTIEKSSSCPEKMSRIDESVSGSSLDQTRNHSFSGIQSDAWCLDIEGACNDNVADDDDGEIYEDCGSDQFISFVAGKTIEFCTEGLPNGKVITACEEEGVSSQKRVFPNDLADQDNYVVFRPLPPGHASSHFNVSLQNHALLQNHLPSEDHLPLQGHAPSIPIFTLSVPPVGESSSDRGPPDGCLP